MENHHVASAFFILKEDKYNVLANISPEDKKFLRNNMINMILETDNANHIKDLARIKGRLASTGNYFFYLFNLNCNS